jgi:lysozyme family protein
MQYFAQIPALSQKLAASLAELVAHDGTEAAVTQLQNALNALNFSPCLFPDVLVDGEFHAETFNALRMFLAHHKHVGETMLLGILKTSEV